jgi:hypothetical protein
MHRLQKLHSRSQEKIEAKTGRHHLTVPRKSDVILSEAHSAKSKDLRFALRRH